MSALFQDLRFALRTLARSPVFALIVVLTLALGIGANTAVFSIVHALLLRPLGYPDEERLVHITTANPTQGWSGANVSIPDYLDWREQSECFAEMGLCFYTSFNLTGGDRPERVSAVGASASLLPALGFEAEIGRAFGPEEDQPGRNQVVVLSRGFWQRRFGGNAGAVGQTVLLDGTPHTVIGVLPSALERAWGPFDAWVPFAIYDSGGGRGERAYTAFGRLAPGVGIAEARSELAGISARIAQAHPETNTGCTADVSPIIDKVVDDTARLASAALFAAVGFVLLIACVNVANLLLSRSAARRREFAVRAAVGAGRWRLMRQVMTECTLLSVLGATVGAFLALWAVDILVLLLPDVVPRRDQIAVNRPVLVFTLLLSLATAVVFGVAPAVRAARVNLNAELKSGAQARSGRSRWLGRDLLVVGEVSLAFALVVGAALMIKSFHRLKSDDPGFEPQNVLTLRVRLPEHEYDSARKRIAFFDQVMEQIRATPGIEAAGAAHILPFDGSSNYALVSTEDGGSPDGGKQVIAGMVIATPGYFETIGTPVIGGRTFTERDDTGGQPVVIVSESLARRCWPDENPVGKRLKYGPRDSESAWCTVVGVVCDVRRGGPDEGTCLDTYLPYELMPGTFMAIVARTTGDPLVATSAVQEAIWKIEPDQAVYQVCALEDLVGSAVGVWGVVGGILGVFASIALGLAMVGLYGVMSCAVSQRTREIGIRLALGAGSWNVLRSVLGRSGVLTLLGVGAGLGLALWMGRALRALLYSVSPADPAVLVGVTAGLVGAALLASYLPARRATRVDPVVALRCE